MPDIKSPEVFFVQQTFHFIAQNTNLENSRILEVGCGKGNLALRLQQAGAQVVAIDPSEEAVKSAKQKGVYAIQASILDFSDPSPFDLIIFTRSLHHIPALNEALKVAVTHLKLDGKLLLEEFDLTHINEFSAQWYYDMLFVNREPAFDDASIHSIEKPLEQWRHDHEHHHPLHTFEKMLTAVKLLFKQVQFSRNPYFYRSIGAKLPAMESGFQKTQLIFEMEKRMIQKKFILPIGVRLVATGKK